MPGMKPSHGAPATSPADRALRDLDGDHDEDHGRKSRPAIRIAISSI